MIFGEYPCCGGALTLGLPKGKHKLPAYAKEECPHCGAIVWHKFSRWDPMSWTEEDFLAEFDIDEKTGMVTPKAKPKSS